jgi:hypothetical protein
MCMGGGDKASRSAARAERKRQDQISGNVDAINQAFAGREPQYAAVSGAIRDRLNTQFQQQRGQATRQNKFALAKSGLTGGSAAVDAGRRLTREAQEGALQVERQAQSAGADLRAKDEGARTQMISLAQSGGDIGNAAAQTASMLRANLGAAQNANLVNGLGDVFGGTADAYKRSQDAAARRRGLSEASTYTKAFSRG